MSEILFFAGEWDREFGVYQDGHSVYLGVKGDGAIDIDDEQLSDLIGALSGLLYRRGELKWLDTLKGPSDEALP